jgi:hypothetical protein
MTTDASHACVTVATWHVMTSSTGDWVWTLCAMSLSYGGLDRDWLIGQLDVRC